MKKLVVIPLIFVSFALFAQKGVTTLGIQLKPIIPNNYFNSGDQTLTSESVDWTLSPKLSFNFGMVIRQGFTKNISLETGINLVRRNYVLSHVDRDFNTALDNRFAFVGYEIPVQGLFYVQLGDKMWMNAAGGLSFDFYPSNIYSNAFDSRDTLNYELEQSTFRKSWVQLGIISNLGFEYRTKDKGYFYFGASFHQPIGDIATVRMTYSLNGQRESVRTNISGNYLTFDLRYFFHEKPDKKRR